MAKTYPIFPQWYWGYISSDKAAEMLRSDGDFLWRRRVEDGRSVDVVSIRWGSEVESVRVNLAVLHNEDGSEAKLYAIGQLQQWHANMEDLVTYMKRYGLPLNKSKPQMRLGAAVKRPENVWITPKRDN